MTLSNAVLMWVVQATHILHAPPILLVFDNEEDNPLVALKWVGHLEYRPDSGRVTWFTPEGKQAADMLLCFVN